MQPSDRLVASVTVVAAVVLVAAVIVGSGGHVPGAPVLPGTAGPAGGSFPAGLGSGGGPSGAPGSGAVGSRGPNGVPPFGHVFVVVMENKEAGAIIGNAAAPYINELASRYALATAYTAVAHPSQPNYLALWSGSTQGVTSDGTHDFVTGTTLADELDGAGRGWHVAAENVPGGCFRGDDSSGGADGPGRYARKHEPAISWLSVSLNPARCANITDFSHFDPTVGSFWFVAPNLCHDMHDCSIATGDAWLRGWLPTILNSPAFADGVVFLTWDEGSSDVGGGGNVAAIVISPLVKPGNRSDVPHDHYSLLRTIQDAWGLPCLANTCAANDLGELFR